MPVHSTWRTRPPALGSFKETSFQAPTKRLGSPFFVVVLCTKRGVATESIKMPIESSAPRRETERRMALFLKRKSTMASGRSEGRFGMVGKKSLFRVEENLLDFRSSLA